MEENSQGRGIPRGFEGQVHYFNESSVLKFSWIDV